MSFIQGVGLNPAGGGAAQPAASMPRGADAVGQGGNAPTTAGGVLTGSQSINNVSFAVSSMMQSIGGGIQNDKMLRMMIALMIIMALLEQQQGESQQGADSGEQLGNGTNGQGVSFSLYSSSTTITTQESVVIYGADASQAYGGQSQGDAGQGGEVDLSA